MAAILHPFCPLSTLHSKICSIAEGLTTRKSEGTAGTAPLLAGIVSSAIASRIGVSRWYAGRTRQGYCPHPRHWLVLAGLVGLSPTNHI